MDPTQAGGTVLSLACGGAAAACLWQRMFRTVPLSKVELQEFQAECRLWVDEVDYDEPNTRTMLALLVKARKHGCLQECEEVIRAGTLRVAKQARRILRTPDAPSHVLALQDMHYAVEDLVSVLSFDEQLAAHLSPEEVQRYHSWLAGMQRRGWVACLRLLASQFKPELLRLVADLAGGVLSLRIEAGEADLMRALSQQEDTALLLPLATTVTLLYAANWMMVYCGEQFRAKLVTESCEEVALRITDNVSRADLKFLGEIPNAYYYIVDSATGDRHIFSKEIRGVGRVFSFLAQSAELLHLRGVSASQTAMCVVAAVALEVCLNGLTEMLPTRRVRKQPDTRIRAFTDISDLFETKEVVVTLRSYGQEVLAAMDLLDEEGKALGAETSRVATRSLRIVIGDFIKQSVKLLAPLYTTGDDKGVVLFTSASKLCSSVRAMQRDVTSITKELWMVALRIDLLLNLPRTIDLGDDVGLRCLEEPHTLDLEGVWFGYDAEDSEAEEEAVEGGEEGEEEEEEETSGSGGEQQKRKGAVLRGIDMHIEAGTHIGIAGPSGCGKSTLMALLSRLYDPQQGVVKLGGRPLSDYNVGWLRREVVCGSSAAMELVSGSIADNVRLSRPEATTEEVREALRAACAVDFVQEKGLMTRTQYDAPDLSSGQAARVLLARALVAKPKILVLDEVSAHLDPVIEDALRKELRALRQSGTTIINVSHRLSFLKDCDAVHVFGGGKIVASGRHKELLTHTVDSSGPSGSLGAGV